MFFLLFRAVVVGSSLAFVEHVEHRDGPGGEPHHRRGAVGKRLHDVQRPQQQQQQNGRANGIRAVRGKKEKLSFAACTAEIQIIHPHPFL